MCGRFVAASDPEGLLAYFQIDEQEVDDVAPSWNVAPTDRAYAVAAHQDKRVLTAFRWGLVPYWADSPKVGARHINARAETVAESRTFAESFQRRRCLIPADGFYEWQRGPDGARLPWYVERADRAPLAFAGLWASWRDPQDRSQRLLTSAIVTTDANADLVGVHDRMPVILQPDDWRTWLGRDCGTEDLLPLLQAPEEGVVTRRRVATAVNNVRNNAPGLLDPPTDRHGSDATRSLSGDRAENPARRVPAPRRP